MSRCWDKQKSHIFPSKLSIWLTNLITSCAHPSTRTGWHILSNSFKDPAHIGEKKFPLAPFYKEMVWDRQTHIRHSTSHQIPCSRESGHVHIVPCISQANQRLSPLHVFKGKVSSTPQESFSSTINEKAQPDKSFTARSASGKNKPSWCEYRLQAGGKARLPRILKVIVCLHSNWGWLQKLSGDHALSINCPHLKRMTRLWYRFWRLNNDRKVQRAAKTELWGRVFLLTKLVVAKIPSANWQDLSISDLDVKGSLTSVLIHVYSSSSWEVEAKGSGFEASLGYLRPASATWDPDSKKES